MFVCKGSVGVVIKRIGVQQANCVWCIASTVTMVIMIAILLVHDASRAYSSTNEARLEWRGARFRASRATVVAAIGSD